MYVTRWKSNQYTSGSYSFAAINQKGDEFNTLAEPLPSDDESKQPPRLLFAGEATHHHFFSTVHGAIESGYREAERIIRIFK